MTITARARRVHSLPRLAPILILLLAATVPQGAGAQPVPPAASPAEISRDYTWLAIGAGALGGVVVLNIVTGGAALAPLMAVPAVEAGTLAASAAARQAACRWSAIVSSAIAGGFIGNWYYNR